MAAISISFQASNLRAHTARHLPLPSPPVSVAFRAPRLSAASLSGASRGFLRAAGAIAGPAEAAVEAEPKSYTTDSLILYFKAEGTMEDRSIPKVTKALEGVEGVSDLEVLIEEGIASVVLTKETTVQATGVASNLVEIIQGAGFKLQTLSLSFKDFDEEDLVAKGGDGDTS